MNLADYAASVLKYALSWRETQNRKDYDEAEPEDYSSFMGPTNMSTPKNDTGLTRLLVHALQQVLEGMTRYEREYKRDKDGKFASTDKPDREEMDEQTHSSWLPGGKVRTLDVTKLIQMVKGRKPVRVKIADLDGITVSRTSGFSKKRMEKTDTSYPLLVEKGTNELVDGRHRSVKLLAQGRKTAMAHLLTPKDIAASVLARCLEGLSRYKKDASGHEHDRKGRFAATSASAAAEKSTVRADQLGKKAAESGKKEDFAAAGDAHNEAGRLHAIAHNLWLDLKDEKNKKHHENLMMQHSELEFMANSLHNQKVGFFGRKRPVLGGYVVDQFARNLSDLAHYVKDKSGHEHAPKGEHGGQFVSEGGEAHEQPEQRNEPGELAQVGGMAKQMAIHGILGATIGTLAAGIAYAGRSFIGSMARFVQRNAMSAHVAPAALGSGVVDTSSLIGRTPAPIYSGLNTLGKIGVGAGIAAGIGGLAYWITSKVRDKHKEGMARSIIDLAHYVKDKTGHQHKGKGKGGGQFAKSGSKDSREWTGAEEDQANDEAGIPRFSELDRKKKAKIIGAGIGIGVGGAAVLGGVTLLAKRLFRRGDGPVDLGPYASPAAFPAHMPPLPGLSPKPIVLPKGGWLETIIANRMKSRLKAKAEAFLEANKHLTVGDLAANLKSGGLFAQRQEDRQDYKKDDSGHEHAKDGKFTGPGQGGEKSEKGKLREETSSIGKLPSVKDHKVYVMNSKIAGILPKFFGIHHRSLAFCPKGTNPVTAEGRSDPKCKVYGLQPGQEKMREEPQRVSVQAHPVKADPHVAARHVMEFNQKYSLISNNCQSAVNKIIERIKAQRKTGNRFVYARFLDELVRYAKHDVSDEPRDESGEWTKGGKTGKARDANWYRKRHPVSAEESESKGKGKRDAMGRFAPGGGSTNKGKLQEQSSVKGMANKGLIIALSSIAAGLVGTAAAHQAGLLPEGFFKGAWKNTIGRANRMLGGQTNTELMKEQLREKKAREELAEANRSENMRSTLDSITKILKEKGSKTSASPTTSPVAMPEEIKLEPEEIIPTGIGLTDPAREAKNEAARRKRSEWSSAKKATKGFVPHARSVYDLVFYDALQSGQNSIEASFLAAEAEYNAQHGQRTQGVPDLSDPAVREATMNYLRQIGFDESGVRAEMAKIDQE